MATIKEMAEEHKLMCEAKGFELNDSYSCITDVIARLHSETSEAFDVIKKGQSYELLFEEVADIYMLLLNLVNIYDIDLEAEFYKKLEINYMRPKYYGTTKCKLPFEEE